MKKFLSITLAVIILFSLVACNKDESDVEQEQNGRKLTEWQEMYEVAIQEYINADIYLSSVYIGDVDGDGIPTVAFSTNPYFYKTPTIIMNYVDGEIAEITNFEAEDSGTAVKEAYYLVNGTKDVVYRIYGDTAGTFGANEIQIIYSISDSGEYEIVSEKVFELSEDMSENYNDMIASGGTDISEYQKMILSQMDDEVDFVTKGSASLLEYQSVARDFTANSESDINLNMKNAIQYINDMLNINLTSEVNDEKSDELFNAENYIGEWGTDYYSAGLYGKTITIHSADDNRINYDIFYYRLAILDNQEATINNNGTADIRATYEDLYIDGKMIFEKNQIKLIVEGTNINGVECETLVFERIKNAPHYRMEKGIANYIDTWETATLEEKSFAGRELFWDVLKYQQEYNKYDDTFLIREFNEVISNEMNGTRFSYETVEISGISESKRISLNMIVREDSVQYEVISLDDNAKSHIRTYDWNGNQISDNSSNDEVTLYDYIFDNL